MNANSATKLLPIVSDEEKLELSLEDDKAVLRLSTWTEDLGWCQQKTLAIDTEMLDDLHRAIAAARYKANREKSDETPITSKILEFPSIS